MVRITAKRDYYSLRLYINDLLHLDVKMLNYNGFQSWYEGSQNKLYFIEVYLKEGDSILLGYDERSTWEEILKLFDKHI